MKKLKLGAVTTSLKRGLTTAIAASLLLLGQGCGTIVSHVGAKGGSTPLDTGTYRGTQTDLLAVVVLGGVGSAIFYTPDGWVLMSMGAVVACDIPLSAVADTITWPHDRTTPPSQGWGHGPE